MLGGFAIAALLGGGLAADAVAQTATTAVTAVVIRGCYVPAIAYVRVLTGTQTCHQGEVAIQWNQTGPAGPQGVPGVAGAIGAVGAAGPAGTNGTNGTNGTDGAAGATGPAGLPGATGPAGPPGSSLASLNGIPCDVGTPTAGVTHAAIDPATRVVTLTCPPSTMYTLTVSATGNSTGNITSTPAGIACGPTAGTACAKDFYPGAQVVVTAVPSAKSRFAGWTGACTGTGVCTVTMGGPQTVSAKFVATITVHVEVSEPLGICYDDSGAGYACPYAFYTGAHAVFDGGSQPDCIDGNVAYGWYAGYNTCDYVVDAGRPTINIDGATESGNIAVFDHWEGCDVVIGARCGVSANGDITVHGYYSK
jgi:hypothetical protein